jgi:hypothetical protein
MRKRTWISWVVVAGVLMHAALLARHHVFLFQTALAESATSTVSIADFPPEAICHSEAGADESGKSKEPPSAPRTPKSTCLICLGFVAAYAVSAAASPSPCIPRTSATVVFLAEQSPFFEFSRFRSPPNRGPPPVS